MVSLEESVDQTNPPAGVKSHGGTVPGCMLNDVEHM